MLVYSKEGGSYEAFNSTVFSFDPVNDVAVIAYTGGTTGLPKGACLSHYNILANIYQIKQVADYMKNEYIKEDLVAISVLPWYHIYGLEMITYHIYV